ARRSALASAGCLRSIHRVPTCTNAPSTRPAKPVAAGNQTFGLKLMVGGIVAAGPIAGPVRSGRLIRYPNLGSEEPKVFLTEHDCELHSSARRGNRRQGFLLGLLIASHDHTLS